MTRWPISPISQQVTQCEVCGKTKHNITSTLRVCGDCIRDETVKCLPFITEAHRVSRSIYGLPIIPPRNPDGLQCNLCSNQCNIPEGGKGFCGIRWNQDGVHSFSTSEFGLLYSYLDPHPTNCCGEWFCPGGTGAGYPKYSYRDGPERGYYNLSVFFYGCNFNCLYCQNSSHKNIENGNTMTTKMFSDILTANRQISCICFFGGSPEPQLPFAINASIKSLEMCEERKLRICFEWNGCGDPKIVSKAAQLSFSSGGNIKFDLKCFTPNLSMALSGVDNRRAFDNFKMIGEKYHSQRPEVPMLTATTLLVSGYVDSIEVKQIAGFIADIDPSIPYSLLIFHPDYMMRDLPITPVSQVVECYKTAVQHLDKVNVGNLHTIGIRDMDAFKILAEKHP